MAKKGFYINVSAPELETEIKKVGAYDGKTRLKIEEAFRESLKNIKNGAQRRVPKRTGELRKSITYGFRRKDMSGYVAARKPYAHLVEFGAKGASAKPKNKKALTVPWAGTGTGGINLSASADIPARRERPYMRPAYEDEKPELLKSIKEAVKP